MNSCEYDAPDFEPFSPVLFALDWYVTELIAPDETLDAKGLFKARRHFCSVVSSPDCPDDERVAAFHLLSEFLRLAREKEARRRRFAGWKAFVVVLLLITTIILWATPRAALLTVLPIAFIVYLFGDSVPLKLLTSFRKG